MSAALDTTAAVARAQAALANAGSAMATLAQTVVEAHKEAGREACAEAVRREAAAGQREREAADMLKAAERREREASRRIVDADARTAAAERRLAAVGSVEGPSREELRKSYRRGYETGYARARAGRPSDVERALVDPRNSLREVTHA